MTRYSVRLTPAGRQDFVPHGRVLRCRRATRRCTSVQTFVLLVVPLCTEWRFVPSGALYRVALCTGWRFVPSGAFRVALSGPPYVALSAQKAPHRAERGPRFKSRGPCPWILWMFVLRPAVDSLRVLCATVACCAGSGPATCLDVWRRRLWRSPKLCLERMPGAERFVLWVDPPFTF